MLQILSAWNLNSCKQSFTLGVSQLPSCPCSRLGCTRKDIFVLFSYKAQGSVYGISAVWLVMPNTLDSAYFASSLKKPLGSSLTFLNFLNSSSKTLQDITADHVLCLLVDPVLCNSCFWSCLKPQPPPQGPLCCRAQHSCSRAFSVMSLFFSVAVFGSIFPSRRVPEPATLTGFVLYTVLKNFCTIDDLSALLFFSHFPMLLKTGW